VLVSTVGTGVSRADEARVRVHAEAFVKAFNDGSRAAAEQFVAHHAAKPTTVDGLLGVFQRDRDTAGTLERAQVRVLPSGKHVFVIAKRSGTGAWENYQFQIDSANDDRLLLFFTAQALEPYPLPAFGVTDERFPAWLDGFIDNMKDTQPFYGTIAIAHGGSVLYERAYGLSDAATNTPNTLSTRFGLASGSKMFTAVAIMQLIESGALRLDDPLSHVLPETAELPGAATITIRHLLTHTSGIGNYWDSEYEKAWGSITEHEHLLPHVLRNFGTPETGTYQYSNSNFALLGLIVERVSKKNFYEYVSEQIFAPAGMHSTGYPLRSEEGAQYAQPYNSVMEAGLVAIGRHDPATLGERGSGAGGASSTTGDMLAFDRALRQGKLVSLETLSQMRSLQAPSEVPRHGYGYGFLVTEGASYGHDGSAPGTQFAFRRYEDADVTVVVMSNFNTIAGPEIAGMLDSIIVKR
jgi:CubicO group peptidase (beta-lactamase class C family)